MSHFGQQVEQQQTGMEPTEPTHHHVKSTKGQPAPRKHHSVEVEQNDTTGGGSGTGGSGGFCNKCGFSLYHYAGKVCNVTGEVHPMEGASNPPPSYAEVHK
jgi:hypothetical protein